MVQIISVLQQKGGAGKSTLLASLGGYMAVDNAKVLIIDTDPQRSCIDWAEEQDVSNLDVVEHLAEDTLLDLIEKLEGRYDTILIDTAGYDSRMASYVIQASDLILIPCRGSKKDVVGAARTWKHAKTLTAKNREAPKIRIVLWNVNTTTNVFHHARDALDQAKLPILSGSTPTLTGFDVMSWNGGLPSGKASAALKSFVASLQIAELLTFYTEKTTVDVMEVADGHA